MSQCRKALCFDTDNKEQMLAYEFLNIIKGRQTEFVVAAVKRMLVTNNLTLEDVTWMDRDDAKLLVKKYCNSKTVAVSKSPASGQESHPDALRAGAQQFSYGLAKAEDMSEEKAGTATPADETKRHAEVSSRERENNFARGKEWESRSEPSPKTSIKSKQELTEKERRLLDELASFG